MLLCLMMAGSLNVHAQKARNRRMGIKADSIIQVKDSLVIDSLRLLEERQKIENMEAPVDTAALVRKNDSITESNGCRNKTPIYSELQPCHLAGVGNSRRRTDIQP